MVRFKASEREFASLGIEPRVRAAQILGEVPDEFLDPILPVKDHLPHNIIGITEHIVFDIGIENVVFRIG